MKDSKANWDIRSNSAAILQPANQHTVSNQDQYMTRLVSKCLYCQTCQYCKITTPNSYSCQDQHSDSLVTCTLAYYCFKITALFQTVSLVVSYMLKCKYYWPTFNLLQGSLEQGSLDQKSLDVTFFMLGISCSQPACQSLLCQSLIFLVLIFWFRLLKQPLPTSALYKQPVVFAVCYNFFLALFQQTAMTDQLILLQQ